MAPAPNDKSDSTSETPTDVAAGYLGVIILSLLVILLFMLICAILKQTGVFGIVGCWIKNYYTRIRAALNKLSLKKAKTEGRGKDLRQPLKPQDSMILKLTCRDHTDAQDTSTVMLQYMVPSPKPAHNSESPTAVSLVQ
ncbi:hypothetical protein PENNAL_c0003G05934 [Penicillium nalgiovense]|uniref:Uncharacterized protein n=1 Tax=Penicillium nalgiovense TaxID=60175 RepID=A0A1V6Z5Z6_PENNA|nr:hypothetical protein PENNAL_c0003G05934 [Penicillium nalgiovense]